MARSLFPPNTYGVEAARRFLRVRYGEAHTLYQRLGPNAKEVKGRGGGANDHVERCLKRAGPDELIKWDLLNNEDVVYAARSVHYLTHNEGSGGWQQYLGTIAAAPPPPFGLQQGFL